MRYKTRLITTTEENLREIFDADFTENEDYYREDTLELGFKDEAERVLKENTNDGKVNISNIIEIAFADRDYYRDLEYNILDLEGKRVITIAYQECM